MRGDARPIVGEQQPLCRDNSPCRGMKHKRGDVDPKVHQLGRPRSSDQTIPQVVLCTSLGCTVWRVTTALVLTENEYSYSALMVHLGLRDDAPVGCRTRDDGERTLVLFSPSWPHRVDGVRGQVAYH